MSRGQALGLIETQGLPAAIEAADAAVKAANVRLVQHSVTVPGMVTVVVLGDIGAVKAAVDAGAAAANRITPVLAAHVIPAPAEGLPEQYYPNA